jgi:hypothetical protein
MHMDTNFLLRQCGLTADQVRTSPLVHRIVSAPTNTTPEYKAKLSYGTEYKRKLRARLKAQGLTVEGKVRKHKQHPELAGLKGAEYRKHYKQLWRADKL